MLSVGLVAMANPPEATLVVHPAPAGAALNHEFALRARVPGGEWQEVPVHAVRVDEVVETGHHVRISSMAFVDFAGTIEFAIAPKDRPLNRVQVRPQSYGVVPVVEGSAVRFSLPQPRNVSVEVNDDRFGNLHLFCSPLETERPDHSDPNVLYFGPGLHDTPQTIRVASGQTVYLAGGAILRGRILCEGVENVRIIGRGMVEQNERRGGIRIAHSKQVHVEGVFTPQCFTGGSRDVVIRNVKCISYQGFGDGMNVISSSNVLIDGVFNRNSDDCITVYGTRLGFTGGASNITVRNSTLWADVAHPILVGTHGNTAQPEALEDLTFSNLDILDHQEAQIDYQGCLSLNAGDSNLIRRVRFENIRIEDFRQGQLVNLRVFYNRKYCTSPGRGIEDVLFRNVTYRGTRAEHSVICGYDDTRRIRNIHFENLTINGRVISDTMKKPAWFKTSDLAGFFVGEHVEGISFVESPSPAADPR